MSICTFVTVIAHFEFGFCSHFLMFPNILYNRILSRVIFCPAFQRPFAAILRPRRSWIDDIVRESGTAQGAPKASHFLEAKRLGRSDMSKLRWILQISRIDRPHFLSSSFPDIFCTPSAKPMCTPSVFSEVLC